MDPTYGEYQEWHVMGWMSLEWYDITTKARRSWVTTVPKYMGRNFNQNDKFSEICDEHLGTRVNLAPPYPLPPWIYLVFPIYNVIRDITRQWMIQAGEVI